jgi:hypothetical protein
MIWRWGELVKICDLPPFEQRTLEGWGTLGLWDHRLKTERCDATRAGLLGGRFARRPAVGPWR